MLKVFLNWAARFLLRAAVDAALNKVIEEAVKAVEKSGSGGADKMKAALETIRASSLEALDGMSDSRLRTLVELKIDELGI